jgi:nitroreductase
MNFLDLAKSRCTTRGFLSEPLAADDLDYVLQAGRVAPSACNRQPQRIVVVQRPENLRKVEKAYATFGAPCVLIVCQDQSDPLVRPWDQKSSGDLDIGIVCDHMMLAARERNLGSVMVGLFDPDIIRAGFDIPQEIAPTALILLGVPRDGFLSPDRHATERRPLEQTVSFETCRFNN